MKKRLQKIIQAFFILFVIAAFGCITAVTLIIAQGGKITPTGITQTGILRINSEPADGIKVFIDGERVSLVDKRVEGLEEGDYTLRIEKEGYLPWEKRVSVDNGIVKEIYASLLKEDLELKQLTNTNIDRVFFSPDGSYAYYVITKSDTPSENGIWRLKLTQNTLESIGLVKTQSERISEITKAIAGILQGEYVIDIAPNNSKIILRNENSSLFFIYYIDQAQLVDIKTPTSLGFTPEKYFWFKNGDSLIAQSGNSVYELNLGSNQITLVYNFQGVDPIFAVNGRNIIIYANDQYYSYENESRSLLGQKFTLPAPDQLWLSQESDDLLFIKSTGVLYFANLKKEIVEIGEYEIVDISNDGQNAILRNTGGALYSFRGELIVATDKISTSTKLIQENYDSKSQIYKFSPDSNYLLERVLYNGQSIFKLIGLYGENTYDLLITSKHVGANNFGLVNGSREFLILLKDTTSAADTGTTQSTAVEANLYKIELVD
ncbi:PEGA domain-containing protein [Candidatus Dojkabacteria bacterium]|nr:PEGA domain-containing protein [Candidatus Dojkabacteria bacterium]